MDTFETAKSFFLEGLAFIQSRNYVDAERKFRASLDLMPGRPSTMTNLSLALINLGRYDEAESVIREILARDSGAPEAWLNLGLIERDSRLNPVRAVEHFDRALSLRSDYVEAHLNRAVALSEQKRHEEALDGCDRAISLNPDSVEAHYNRAMILWDMQRFAPAIAAYDTAFNLDPDFDYLLGKRLHAKMHLCDWTDYANQRSAISDKIRKGEKAATPFQILSLVDDPALQLKGTAIWVLDMVRTQAARPKFHIPSETGKIRIGYFSADFRDHPVASLIAEIFELHDRSRFEIIGFSYGPENNGDMRKRIIRACDAFHDVRGLPDNAVASLSRENHIDIAVDLTGYTDFTRPGLFASGCASVQVNYLGYPGTWASAAVDYIVADEILIPAADRRYYSEKVAYLPFSHMPHDRKRAIADKVPTREDLGLPRSGTVFCCFNNIYKFTPDVFESWMRILNAVDGSVLWLLSENTMAIGNLRAAAEAHGIDPHRLIFAGRLAPADHLARYRAADIFLDTLPYNAHLTACDALWAGLPVITCKDRVIVSRIAASVLCAAGLGELVTEDRASYERLAIDLARTPERLRTIRAKLEETRISTPLFDLVAYTRYIEDAYMQMYGRCRSGIAPDHIFVGRAAGFVNSNMNP